MRTESLLHAALVKFVDLYHDAREKVHPLELARAATDRAALFDAFEDHGREMITPLVTSLLNPDTMPDELRPLLTSLTGSDSFTGSLEITAAVGAIVFIVIQTLMQPLIQDPLNTVWSQNQNIPLTPDQVALNELRGGSFKGDGAHEAAFSGLNAFRYQAMVENTGEPPAIQELLFLLRRGKIGAGDVERGIRQSRVRDEWISAVIDLEYGPPSAADAIGAAVRNLLSEGDAQQVVAENGIDPKYYPWLRESAGRPPGIEQMLSLLNRGLVDAGTVTRAIRESDIKDKYIPQILQMARHLMPERTVVSAISKGVFTHEQGIEHLLLLGFSPDDAAALASEATGTKVAAGKQISESLVVRGYTAGLLSRGDADTELVALGYDEHETGFLLDLADADLVTRAHESAVTSIRTRVIAHHLSAQDATTALVNLGVPGARAGELVGIYETEASANPAHLTVAVLGWLAVNGWLTDQEYLARLADLGYRPADAALQLAYATKATPPTGGG